MLRVNPISALPLHKLTIKKPETRASQPKCTPERKNLTNVAYLRKTHSIFGKKNANSAFHHRLIKKILDTINPMLSSIRRAFLSGVILLAPLGITFFVFNWLVLRIGGSFKAKVFFFIPHDVLLDPDLTLFWDFTATIIVICLITVLGFLSRYFFAKYLWSLGERLLHNLPGINTVYTSVKQIVDTFSSQNRAVFEKVVLIQFPRKGSYAIGFLTGNSKGEIRGKANLPLRNIFVPTTPNPTSGFLVMLHEDDVQELDMTVGEGMKFIISGGAVVPDWKTIETTEEPNE